MAAKLHFAEDAFALHLLLQRLQRLVDIVVPDDDLHVRLDPFSGADARLSHESAVPGEPSPALNADTKIPDRPAAPRRDEARAYTATRSHCPPARRRCAAAPRSALGALGGSASSAPPPRSPPSSVGASRPVSQSSMKSSSRPRSLAIKYQRAASAASLSTPRPSARAARAGPAPADCRRWPPR